MTLFGANDMGTTFVGILDYIALERLEGDTPSASVASSIFERAH